MMQINKLICEIKTNPTQFSYKRLFRGFGLINYKGFGIAASPPRTMTLGVVWYRGHDSLTPSSCAPSITSPQLTFPNEIAFLCKWTGVGACAALITLLSSALDRIWRRPGFVLRYAALMRNAYSACMRNVANLNARSRHLVHYRFWRACVVLSIVLKTHFRREEITKWRWNVYHTMFTVVERTPHATGVTGSKT